MLKIIPASEPVQVERLVVVLYSPPGIGKTATACTANKPLLLDFDRGSYRTEFRSDWVQIETWQDVSSITADDLDPFGTVVVDTVGRAIDMLGSAAMLADAKNRTRNGTLSISGWGWVKNAFTQWLSHLRLLGKDVILLAHMDEQRRGDDVLERLDVPGGSKTEIYKVSDLMGRLVYDSTLGRLLLFSPTDTAYGKNPAGFDPIKVPNFSQPENRQFLAGVLDRAKDALNRKSAVAIERQQQLDGLKNLDGVDAFNEQLKEWRDAPKDLKRALVAAAQKAGLSWGAETKQFVEAGDGE